MYYILLDPKTIPSILSLNSGQLQTFDSWDEADEAGQNAVYQELAKEYQVLKICANEKD